MRLVLRGAGAHKLLRRWSSLGASIHPVPDLANEANVDERIHFLSLKQPTPLTMQEILAFHSAPSRQKLQMSACFLHEEIPIRLARRVKELVTLPHGLSDMSTIKAIADQYRRTTLRIQSHPKPNSEAAEKNFTEMVNDILNAHEEVQLEIAASIRDLKQQRAQRHDPLEVDFSEWLDKL